MSVQFVGITSSSENEIASGALVQTSRVAFTEPTSADRSRARWARADVLLAGEGDSLVSRRNGVAIVAVDPSRFAEVFEHVPDPVVLVIAPAGTALPAGGRFVLIPRYAGCCYSVRVVDGSAIVTELTRPPAEAEPEPAPVPARTRPRRERRRRRRAPVEQPVEASAPEPDPAEGEQG